MLRPPLFVGIAVVLRPPLLWGKPWRSAAAVAGLTPGCFGRSCRCGRRGASPAAAVGIAVAAPPAVTAELGRRLPWRWRHPERRSLPWRQGRSAESADRHRWAAANGAATRCREPATPHEVSGAAAAATGARVSRGTTFAAKAKHVVLLRRHTVPFAVTRERHIGSAAANSPTAAIGSAAVIRSAAAIGSAAQHRVRGSTSGRDRQEACVPRPVTCPREGRRAVTSARENRGGESSLPDRVRRIRTIGRFSGFSGLKRSSPGHSGRDEPRRRRPRTAERPGRGAPGACSVCGWFRRSERGPAGRRDA
ncbi:hypothetical protein J2S44_004748 [Catenuloplanes niger]|uniref:Uncharacterized protein n=1 Tax=Catenuloplanes niger TaxID=587534 RepID=A0AAE3ZR22_9ACTN|nr:hypothetical protein [Catenuloplanes niger]